MGVSWALRLPLASPGAWPQRGPQGSPWSSETKLASVPFSFRPWCPAGCQAPNTPESTLGLHTASALPDPLTTLCPGSCQPCLDVENRGPGHACHLLQGGWVRQDWNLPGHTLSSRTRPSHTRAQGSWCDRKAPSPARLSRRPGKSASPAPPTWALCLPAHLVPGQLLPGQLHQPVHFGGHTEILEEALVGRPELAPQGLAGLQADPVGGLLEHAQGLGPLQGHAQLSCCGPAAPRHPAPIPAGIRRGGRGGGKQSNTEVLLVPNAKKC